MWILPKSFSHSFVLMNFLSLFGYVYNISMISLEQADMVQRNAPMLSFKGNQSFPYRRHPCPADISTTLARSSQQARGPSATLDSD